MPKIARRYRRKYVLWAAALAGLILFATYLLSNLSFPISSENQTLKWAYELTSGLRDTDKPVPSDYLFINTSYDRALVDITDEYGFPRGNTDITDRAKLVSLLRLLAETRNYRYIVMDLRFEKGMQTDYDSLLRRIIARTANIVIPRHADISVDTIAGKSALADFSASIDEGDFTKYIIAAPGGSMAYRVYQDLTGSDYTSFCGLYFSQGRLMRRAMLINLDINPTTECDADGNKKIYNLGADILANPDEAKLLFKDKIIFIGDYYERDIHPTYKGSMAGVVIHANALRDIMAGRHLISWWTVLALWLFLSLTIWLIIAPHRYRRYLNISRWVPRRWMRSKTWAAFRPLAAIIMAFLGYGSLMTVVFFILYLLTGRIFEIICISIILVIISIIAKNRTS